jgi:hypothetical protein
MSTWRFRKYSLLKQYLVENLPENLNPKFGYSLSDFTTPLHAIAALERIFADKGLYDNASRPNFVNCDEQLRVIVGCPRIYLYQNKLQLKRIVYAHLVEIPQIKVEKHYYSREIEFPLMTRHEQRKL